MHGLDILKFWRNAAVGAEFSPDSGELRDAAFGSGDTDTDSEDSFFDLVLKSPDASKRGFLLAESPRDVFLGRNDDVSSSKPSSPVALLRATTKLKVFTLGFRKSSKCDKSESNGGGELKSSPLNQVSRSSKIEMNKQFKFKLEEVPVASVFVRDNSLRSKLLKENVEREASLDAVHSGKSVPKYLKLIKPLYSKHSKKGKITETVTPSSSPLTVPMSLSPRKSSESNRVGNFIIAARNSGKSRSATTLGGAAPPLRRRDDSLLEQHDGIQGAILHCKKSYNAASQDFSQLFRSASDTSHDFKMRSPCRNSCEEQKRCSI